MASIACISLLLINFAFNDNSHKKIEDMTSRIIFESPKKAEVSESKEGVNDEGTRMTVPSAYGKPVVPVQPLPVPDPNVPIVITPIS
jgi:hypothetical protein